MKCPLCEGTGEFEPPPAPHVATVRDIELYHKLRKKGATRETAAEVVGFHHKTIWSASKRLKIPWQHYPEGWY